MMLRDDVVVDVPQAAEAMRKLLFLFFFQAALPATGAGGQSSGATRITPERTDSLSYYAHCKYNALRDGVVKDFTTCASEAGSQTIAAGVRLTELQPDAKFLLDSFDSVTQWRTNPSSGVEITIHADSGRTGRGMRVDFDFHGHTGYGIVGRQVNLELPANYRFEFAVRGSAPSNTLEFKLVDPTGANVWWSNNPGFVFAPEWTSVVRTKREICFAWGPSGGGEIRRVAGIEFAITAGSGGKGSIWIDDLSVAAVDPDSPFDVIAPVTAAPIVGTWESAAVPNGAIGSTLDFASDGSATVTIGASTAFIYDVAANRLTTTINNPAGGKSEVHTSLIRIERDTLTQQDVNGATPDVSMKRVRRGAKSDDSILGVWSFLDNTGASAFVQFGRDGRGLFRAPMSSCSGTWTTPGGASLALTINGKTAGFDYSIQNAALRMKDSQGREISYTRRTPPE